MELTGAAESGATGRTMTRRGSVRVERRVRTTSRNRPPEHAECTVSGANVRVWKVMNHAEKEKALELLRERKGAGVEVSSMIAEIHGPFVERQTITPICSGGRTAKMSVGRQSKRAKEQEMPSGPNVWS